MAESPDACRACGAPPPIGQYGLCGSCLKELGRPFFSGSRALTAMLAGAPLGAALLIYLGVDDLWALLGGGLGTVVLIFVGGILVDLVRVNGVIARHAGR